MPRPSTLQRTRYHTPPRSPRAQQKKQNPGMVTCLTILAALAIMLPLMLFSITTILFQVLQLNLPNTFVYDKDVGMMSREDTETWVDIYWNQERQIQLLSLDDGENNLWLKPQELGLYIDSQATADSAYIIGRGSDPFSDIFAAISGHPQVIWPVLYYDQSTAQNTLDRLADTYNIPPVNASIEKQNGEWVAFPGKVGKAIDFEATLSSLTENTFSTLLTQSLSLQTKPVNPEVSDLSPILEEINLKLSKELQLEAYDPITDQTLTWSVPVETKNEWLTVDPQTFEIRYSIDQAKIEGFFLDIAQELDDHRALEVPKEISQMIMDWENELPVQTTIRYKPTNYQVQGGESLWSISLKLGIPMWYILESNQGLTTNNLEAGMNLIIPSKNDLLPLPVITNKRIVVDISTQRMIIIEDGLVKNTHVISTGMSDSPTMAGIFQVQTHILNAYASNWDLYMPHFLGIYEAWPGFMNGIHGLPLLSSGQRLWAGNLGTPVSYGCIILDLAAAEDLYHWAEPGVVVEIRE